MSVTELLNDTRKNKQKLATAINGKINELAGKVKDLNYDKAEVIFIPDGDVYKNYTWGVNTKDQAYINEVPVIILTEYQPNAGPLLEELAYTLKTLRATANALAGVQLDNPYLKLYQGVLTGNVYRLPFFSQYNHTLGSTWDFPENETIMSDIRNTIGKTSGIFQRGLIEKRRIWKGSTSASYSFSFTLYNTFGGVSNIFKNFEFIRALVHNNLATRTSFATLLPPCFYKLEIPGVRYAPIAALDGIDVSNIGQINRKKVEIPIGGGYVGTNTIDMNIPDAWKVTISVNELHNETREIYDSTFNSTSKINVIDSGDETQAAQNVNKLNIGGGGILQ